MKIHTSTLGKKYSLGFSVLEIAVVLIIVSLMISITVPAFDYLVDTAKVEKTEVKMEELVSGIDDYFDTNGVYPDTLAEVFGTTPLDEWGNPYQYLRIDGGSNAGKGKIRKDKNLVPINSDYDFYSMGPDGKSASPLTSALSKDDIVRGRNGDFLGLAEDF